MKIYFSVTNDLSTDQRVHRIITSLLKSGASVTLVGRRLRNSIPLAPRTYHLHRMKLFFEKGFLFYAFYNIRLFLFLLTRREMDILVANDLDTLPANFLVSRIRKIPLVYDSHEYFTEVPELIDRHFVRRFWEGIEKRIIPKLKIAYTVSQPIADLYKQKYGVDFEVIHNYPFQTGKANEEFQLPFDPGTDKLLLYQGAVNKGRGLELLMEAVSEMQNVKLVIAGDGDLSKSLEKKIIEKQWGDRIFMVGKIPFEKLRSLSRKADAGVSLEEDMGLNYRFAMPNKLFDYIQAGIPVIVSDLPEMRKIVDKYVIGIVVDKREKENIKEILRIVLFDVEKRLVWKKGIEKASRELCWKREESKLIAIYRRAGVK